MRNMNRTLGFWMLESFIIIAIALIILGQTTAVFNYDFAVRQGLQESEAQVSEYGVQVNRAFGAADTIIYVPILISSFIGIWLRKQWVLIITGAMAGISLYWSSTILFMFAFLPGTEGYNYIPDFEIWSFVITFALFGCWTFWFLIKRGRELFD